MMSDDLRLEIAAKFMAAMIARGDDAGFSFAELAKDALAGADALLAVDHAMKAEEAA